MAYTTINKSTDYFETTTYTGGATDVSSLSFQPDFVWAKKRNGDESHGLFDAVRGATKALKSNSVNSEDTRSGSLTSFDNDGWSMGGSDGIISASGSTYVGWAWKANGAGSANTAGSINSTATSANTTAGFSIVKYTGNQTAGATVGHGLGSVPKMIIVKNLNDSENWVVYHNKLGNTDGLYLNTTDSTVGTNTFWNNTTPTTTLFTLGTHDRVNNVNIPYIAYCFAEKTGYSKFGKYIGNGNANGTFVYTGFKPEFYMIKRTSSSGSWIMKDNKRPGYNVNGSYILANDAQAEQTGSGNVAIDELSNGFKIRGTSSSLNADGETYIYMAFGQSLVGTNGVTAKAR